MTSRSGWAGCAGASGSSTPASRTPTWAGTTPSRTWRRQSATPWPATSRSLDEDVTTTAREGLYVVYLFSEPLDRAYLSMNQGVTAHLDHLTELRGRAREDAAAAEL